MVQLLTLKNDIVKVLFYLNLILLAVGIFYSSKAYLITVLILNLIFNGTFMVINKWSSIFESREGPFGTIFGKLGNSLDYLNSMGDKSGKVQR